MRKQSAASLLPFAPLRSSKRAGLWIAVCVAADISGRSVVAFAQNKRRQSRYFTGDLVLPPLPRVDATDATVSKSTKTFTTGYEFDRDLFVRYTNDPKTVSKWLSDHVPSMGCTLGFDVESVPNCPWMKGKISFLGPATVQLATPKASLVVHLARCSRRPSRACVPILEAVLRDEAIVKAGVSIDDDMLELRQEWGAGLEARSRLELGWIGAALTGSLEPLGLKRLSRTVLGRDLPKSRRLAISDWSQVPLTKPQLAYSARDAWVAAAVVNTLGSHDPETFATTSIVDHLRSQQSVKELYRRRVRRKKAKNLLSALLAPYSSKRSNAEVIPRKRSEMPKWKAQVAEELKNAIKENQPPRSEASDVERLCVRFLNETG